MAKLTAWLVTIVGAIMVLAAPGIALFDLGSAWVSWVMALAVLVIGIGKLVRNYKRRK